MCVIDESTTEPTTTTQPPVCATDTHFTGKERDQESGNDYFGARYYASTMGRMMSPDPSDLIYADPRNPQSLNLYSYVRNNPLLYLDPDGEFCYSVNQGDGTVTVDNQAQSASDCSEGSSWIDGTADSLNLYNSRLVPGTHWCGPGGGGPTTNADDAACREHDRAYGAAGVRQI